MPYAEPVAAFAHIQDEFLERVHGIVRCTAATVDTRGRPRSRIWHPIWDGRIGRIATNRYTLKTGHLANNPYISLSYFDPRDPWRPVYVDCHTEWDDTPEGKSRAWQMFVRSPAPVGYDPAMIWNMPENPNFGVLVLYPWRIELVDAPGDSRVWRQQPQPTEQ